MSAASAKRELERMDVVVVGHVDHGKSTVIGRLMADTGSLPHGKLEQVKEMCARNARPFEYAFLLDALKNEQAQGITIDTARCFFNTANRHYILHDAPGHVEFLKNMITGASRAQAALLVIDAHEGVKENSKRHGYILSMLGIRQVAVLVNKMDLLGWDRDAFDAVTREYAEFLGRIGVHPTAFIPISAREGENIVESAAASPWYSGPSVLEQIESFQRLDDDLERPFRMPLQDVYKFTAENDDRRIFVGTVETGRLQAGDEVEFVPSGKRSKVRSIEVLSGEPPAEVSAGQAVGFTLDTQVYAKPGELVVKAGDLEPVTATRIRANVFWMGVAPLVKGRRYVLRLGTAKVAVELDDVLSVLDATDLATSSASQVERHEVAEVVLRAARPIAFDPADVLEPTSRFVIVNGYDIAGCGIAIEPLAEGRDTADAGGERFAAGLVGPEERHRRYRHAGKVVVLVGEDGEAVHAAGALLERRLFDLGAHSSYLGAISVGAERDVLVRDARLQQVAEIGWAMTNAGVVLVTALADIDRFDLDRLRAVARPAELFVAAVGDGGSIDASVTFEPDAETSEVVQGILRALTEAGILPEYHI